MKDLHVILSVVFIGMVSLLGCEPFAFDKPHQSDKALILNFEDHAAQFVELVKMANEDKKVVRIARDFTWLEDNVNWPRPEAQRGISEMRWDQYRRLFRELGITDGLARYDDPSGAVIHLTVFSMGLLDRGISKGYAYSEVDLSPVVDSLDKRPDELRGSKQDGVVYRKIRGNWYLYFEW